MCTKKTFRERVQFSNEHCGKKNFQMRDETLQKKTEGKSADWIFPSCAVSCFSPHSLSVFTPSLARRIIMVHVCTCMKCLFALFLSIRLTDHSMMAMKTFTSFVSSFNDFRRKLKGCSVQPTNHIVRFFLLSIQKTFSSRVAHSMRISNDQVYLRPYI